MKKIIGAIFICLSFTALAGAEVATYASANTAAKNLAMPAGARPAGLGEAFTGAWGDINALYWNPAGLNGISEHKILLEHHAWIEGISQEHAAYAQPLTGLGVVGLGLDYLNYGSIERWSMDASGNPSPGGEAYTPYAFSGILGWALPLPMGKGLGAGAALKLSYEQLDNSGSLAGAVDLGVNWQPNPDLCWGASLRNLGVAAGEKLLPLALKVGSAFNLPYSFSEKDLLTTYADLEFKYDEYPTLGLGLEYTYIQWFQVRLGWNQNFGHANPTRYGLTAGAGVNLFHWGLDYALAPQGDLGLSHRISLSYGF